MNIVIDTNRYRDGDDGEATAVAVLKTADQICVPFIVLGELRYGFLHGTKTRENELRLRRFLQTARIKTFFPDERTTQEYAKLALQLRKQGTPIPTNDIWIAALTIQHNLTLFARDRHFDHLPQLARV